jgi:hypothetical protein
MWNSDEQDGDSSGIFARQQKLVPAFASVDAHAGTGTSSDANGVLEPEERVLLEPAWANRGHFATFLTGSLSNFSGPAGGIYLVNDGAADYGFIPSRSTGGCNAGDPEPCYQLSVGGTRPATHWDATVTENVSAEGSKVWTLHVGDSFTDVPRAQPFYVKIETVFHHGIAAGCGPASYCPSDPVSRAQMAIFLARGIAGGGASIPVSGTVGAQPYNCVGGGVSLFADVPPTDIACKSVHYLAAQNVVAGCAPGLYCPAPAVTRAEMAIFVARAIVAPAGGSAVPVAYGPDPDTGLSYSCNPGSPNLHFTDVSTADIFCKHAHFLWARGIVGGCSATQYCPAGNVSRDQMAKFLANAFNLLLYGP